MKCRHCAQSLDTIFADLATSPPSNSYLRDDMLDQPEPYYPLEVYVCSNCFLVQTKDFAERDVFFSADYAYFSSTSKSWLAHSEAYVTAMMKRFDLGADHCLVEVASNDGYLLQFAQRDGLPCYGIEPTHSTAEAARKKGLEVIEDFFGEKLGRELAAKGKAADLTAANNVLAHVPDINDFAAGFREILTPTGVSTFEFPHLLNLVSQKQFDTIYHEHYSYLSLIAVQRIFAKAGLTVFDVEKLPTHGGSLRVFAMRTDTAAHDITPNVQAVIDEETAAGMTDISYYQNFQDDIMSIRDGLLEYLIDARRKGLRVAAYGAAAKGNTLLNFSGVRSDLVSYVADAADAKQGKFMPGSRIPIVSPDDLLADKPDRILILPWNIADEVINQLDAVASWGGKFVIAVPELTEIAPKGA